MTDEAIRKEYANNEVVVVWQPDLCTHSANCIRGLPAVFDTRRRPWIDPLGASPAAIVEQVRKCPSGALSYRPVAALAAAETTSAGFPAAAGAAGEGPIAAASAAPPPIAATVVKVSANGPLLVAGAIRLTLPDGSTVDREGKTALCRCGASTNKPFCDGSHHRVGFAG